MYLPTLSISVLALRRATPPFLNTTTPNLTGRTSHTNPVARHLNQTISSDGHCGIATTCLGSTFGDSCSQYGWCGSNSSYSGAGCQPDFGKCDDDPSAVAENFPEALDILDAIAIATVTSTLTSTITVPPITESTVEVTTTTTSTVTVPPPAASPSSDAKGDADAHAHAEEVTSVTVTSTITVPPPGASPSSSPSPASVNPPAVTITSTITVPMPDLTTTITAEPTTTSTVTLSRVASASSTFSC